MKVGPISYKDAIKIARKLNFSFRRSTSGSHEVWWNEKTRKTCVIPHHREIVPNTVRSMIKQMGVTEEEFIKLK